MLAYLLFGIVIPMLLLALGVARLYEKPCKKTVISSIGMILCGGLLFFLIFFYEECIPLETRIIEENQVVQEKMFLGSPIRNYVEE